MVPDNLPRPTGHQQQLIISSFTPSNNMGVLFWIHWKNAVLNYIILKEVAESHGLIIEYNEKLGWSLSRLNDNTKSIVDSMGLNKEAFSLARMDFSNLSAGGKSSTRKYVCPQCGAIIRTSKELKVICGECLVPFELS
jgi:ribosomal protein S27AE